MLRFGKFTLAAVWSVASLLVLLLLVAPVLVTLITALAGSWNSVLPDDLTLRHIAESVTEENLASLSVSLQTAILAGAAAVVLGTWASLAARSAPVPVAATIRALFHFPVAVPSVVVGLGLLIAFSKGALTLNGTLWLVVIAQSLLVLAFAFTTVSASLEGMDPLLPQQAASLGAKPWRILLTVRLPLLLPALAAASGLSFALCVGELGATIMVYPASWRTLPVSIFAFSDRGNIFMAAACTLVLLMVAFLVLMVIARLRGSAARSAQ